MYRGQEDRVREVAGFVLDMQGLGGQGGCPAGIADTDLRLSGRRVLIETRGRRTDVGGWMFFSPPTFRGWGKEPDLAEGSELVMLVMAGPGLGRFT